MILYFFSVILYIISLFILFISIGSIAIQLRVRLVSLQFISLSIS